MRQITYVRVVIAFFMVMALLVGAYVYAQGKLFKVVENDSLGFSRSPVDSATQATIMGELSSIDGIDEVLLHHSASGQLEIDATATIDSPSWKVDAARLVAVYMERVFSLKQPIEECTLTIRNGDRIVASAGLGRDMITQWSSPAFANHSRESIVAFLSSRQVVDGTDSQLAWYEVK